jgi:mono/diheme cytochrome c family protein
MRLQTITRPDTARRFLEIALTLSLALALQACGGSDDAAPPKADPAPQPTAPAEPAAAPTPEPAATPAATPAADAGGDAPAAVDEASLIAAGSKSYQTFCAACHGATGDAQTPIGQALSPPPTRHDNGEYMGALTDDYIFKVIKEGGMAVGKSPMMAPWGGSLSDEQIREVVAFIRTLAKN